MLNAELKSMNSILTYESLFSRWVRARWRVEEIASSVERFGRYANWSGSSVLGMLVLMLCMTSLSKQCKLCKLVQKLTQIILPDADITIASLNSDLNVIWLLILLFFIIIISSSMQGGKYIKCARGKSVYGNSHWPKHARKRVVGKKIQNSPAITDIAFGRD